MSSSQDRSSSERRQAELLVVEARESHGGTLKLALQGELDMGTAPELEARLAALSEARSPAKLDLSGLTFVDSTGLRVLLGAVRDADRDGWKLEVGRELSPQVRRLVELTGTSGSIWPE